MRYYMFNKPKNCVTARTDAMHRTVMDFFPEDMRSELHPIGRLDKDTEGLILVTDDGMLTHRLMQPKSHVMKTYFFYAVGKLDDDKVTALKRGVLLTGQDKPTLPADIVCTGKYKITEIEGYLPEDKKEKLLKNPDQDIFSGLITITEGRNHQVKRMLRAINCCIMYLERIEIGGVKLDSDLPRGQYRPLTEEEKMLLHIK